MFRIKYVDYGVHIATSCNRQIGDADHRKCLVSCGQDQDANVEYWNIALKLDSLVWPGHLTIKSLGSKHWQVLGELIRPCLNGLGQRKKSMVFISTHGLPGSQNAWVNIDFVWGYVAQCHLRLRWDHSGLIFNSPWKVFTDVVTPHINSLLYRTVWLLSSTTKTALYYECQSWRSRFYGKSMGNVAEDNDPNQNR